MLVIGFTTALLVAFVMLSSQLPFLMHPGAVEIEIHEVAGRLSFDFHRRERTWWGTQNVPAPAWSVSIKVLGDAGNRTVRDDEPGKTRVRDDELWKIVSPGAKASVSSVQFGHVPPGFTQQTPAMGAPPELTPGRAYRVSVRAGTLGGRRFMVRYPAHPSPTD